jgi:hypothetical protein
MKREFKVGDRVNVYWSGNREIVGEIEEIESKDCLVVVSELDGSKFWAHPKQCRHFKPKPKRKPREIWIVDHSVNRIGNTPSGSCIDYIQVSSKKIIDDDVLFREVLPKKKGD